MKSGELVAEVITHTVDTPRLDRPRSSGVRATPLKRGIDIADAGDIVVVLVSLQRGEGNRTTFKSGKLNAGLGMRPAFSFGERNYCSG